MNITREFIEQLNMDEPYCFKNGREEQWFYTGLKYGLEAADNNPKLPWISVKNDLPCNHKELVIKGSPYTKRVMVIEDGGYYFDLMILSNNGKWKWLYSFHPTHWMPIPKMPKRNRKKL